MHDGRGNTRGHSGTIDIHVAVGFFGLAGLFGKLVDQPATIIVLGRVFFAALFLAAVIAGQGRSLRLQSGRDYRLLLLQGAILAVHWITFFKAIQIATVAVGLLTFATFPVFVTFLEPLFFGEQLRRGDVLLALAAFGGVALVVPAFELDNRIAVGAAYGTLSGLTFAGLSLLNRRYARTYSSLVVAFYQDAAACALLLPVFFLKRPALPPHDWLLLALLGIVFTGLAHTLFIKGLARVKAHAASVIACLEPVYGIAAAAVLLGEVPSLRALAGGAVILGAALTVSLRKAA